MNRKEKLEEELRISACLGDIIRVEELIHLGVDVNSRHPRNGRYDFLKLLFRIIIFYIFFVELPYEELKKNSI